MLIASLVGAAATLVVVADVGGTLGLRVARVKTVDVYVTAVDARQTSIGYTDAPGADVRGTYNLRGLDVWADGDLDHRHLNTPQCVQMAVELT